ncbi:MAG: hypothetical protein PHY48_16495 [Candidatus Cloacimonetes bacterium]|jgi:prolyl oligopeptidase PreP (S9A serine peptidase family)|nr:hypothetical protein [Candidatus Cloacimonadota bacterium]MDY0325067.1 hypothetical protein [Candidatus Cloacimonadaceae bacterium]
MKYPRTPKGTITDDYFCTPVPDPYRWLEDNNSPATLAWVKEQQVLTEAIPNQYPSRKAMLARLQELSGYPKQSCHAARTCRPRASPRALYPVRVFPRASNVTKNLELFADIFSFACLYLEV